MARCRATQALSCEEVGFPKPPTTRAKSCAALYTILIKQTKKKHFQAEALTTQKI